MVLSHEHPGAVPPPDQGSGALNRNATLLARLVAEGRLGPGIGVTARGRKDGAGAQAMAILSAMAMARFVGCSYLHSPFASVAHAEGTPQDWARRWESFLNFGDGEALVPTDAELVPMSVALHDPDAYRGRPIVIVEPVFDLSGEVGVAIRDGLRGALRAKYWRSPKAAIPSHRAPQGLTAAVHLRRGDVSLTRNANRYAHDEVVLRQIARLRDAVAPFGRMLTVNLYSQGSVEDFRAFTDAGCILHVSEDTFESFHNMVTADILVNATSTFSYVAGLLSRGIVLDHRRAPGFSNWVSRRGNGDISIKRVRQALLARSGWLERCAFRIRRRWPSQ
jgi:hypothetical protein